MQDEGGGMRGREAGLLRPFSFSSPYASERIFSSGKIPADDTVVKMKMLQRLADVTVVGF